MAVKNSIKLGPLGFLL